MVYLLRLAATLLFLSPLPGWTDEPVQVVHYLRHQGTQDPYLQHLLELLQLAAQKSGQRMRFVPTDETMNQGRAMREMAQRLGKVDILWMMTTFEREANAERALEIENTTVIQYPAALYFFIGKHDEALAQTLERGLEITIQDGSFDRVFSAHFNDPLQLSKLNQRKRIELANPFLPPETSLQRKEL